MYVLLGNRGSHLLFLLLAHEGLMFSLKFSSWLAISTLFSGVAIPRSGSMLPRSIYMKTVYSRGGDFLVR